MNKAISFYVPKDIKPESLARDLGLRLERNDLWYDDYWITSIMANMIRIEVKEKYEHIIKKARTLDYLKEI